MISLEDVKSLVIDIVAAMTERLRIVEEEAGMSFRNRTNIYRCEDGRPVCYCCLRVGHVAKYCWDRRYSCPHVYMDHRAPPEPSMDRDKVDLQSLGRDVDKLLKELQGLTNELQLLRTAPFRANEFPRIPESVADGYVGKRMETEPLKSTPNMYQRRSHCPYTERSSVQMHQTGNTALASIDCRDVT